MQPLYAFTLRVVCIAVAAIALVPEATSAQTIEYYHLDALGSVRAVTDQSGTVIERHDFLPFGDEVNPPVGPQPRQFTGKERDSETGLDYFGARYFSGKTGRFTSVDPVYTWRENLTDPQRWNRYAYVRNNPLRYTDPDGRCIDGCVLEGYALYAAAGSTVIATTAWLASPAGQQALSQAGAMITSAVGTIQSWFRSGEAKQLPQNAGPTGHISPSEVIGKTPSEIEKRAGELGLAPRGPDAASGRGSYVDPATGEQRILSHPNDPKGPHGHINNPAGERVGPDGRAVAPNSKEAHLPIKKEGKQ